MALHHAASGEVIDIHPLKDQLAGAASTALCKTGQLEIMRMVLHAGKSVSEHSVPGEVTIQCLEGTVELRLQDQTRILRQSQMVCLAGGMPHALHALDDASVLCTIVLVHGDGFRMQK